MKTTIIAILVLTSLSALAAGNFKTMPKGALRTGTVAQGNYEFLKVTYDERDGFKPRENLKVIVNFSGVKQETNPRYTQYVGQMGSENLGRATNVDTKLQVQITDGKDNFSCNLASSGLSDGMDSIGYDDAELKCDISAKKKNIRVILKDYSENRVNAADAHYEVIVNVHKSGAFSGKDTSFSAEIKAN